MFREVGPLLDCFVINDQGERADKFTDCFDGVISCCLKLLIWFDHLTAASDTTRRGFVYL